MIKKTVDDAVLDAVLAKAFEEAAERDLAEMETDPEAARRYPEAYKKIERKQYNQANRRAASSHSRSSFMLGMKRVASFVLIIGFVGCCLMLSAPKIRAEFAGLVTKFFEKCFSITLPTNVTTYETENFVFGYIPDSFIETDINEKSFKSTYSFISSGTNSCFSISIHKGINVISQFDFEHTEVNEIDINGFVGYMINADSEDQKLIVWTDNINLYSIAGNVSEVELIKIAENISVK